MSLNWEVSCGDPGNTVVGYFENSSEVLEFSGKLLYGNVDFLFQIVRLDVRLMEPGEIPDVGSDFTPQTGVDPRWTLRTRGPDGTVSVRLIETRHELFGMLIADLKRGATVLSVYDLKAV